MVYEATEAFRLSHDRGHGRGRYVRCGHELQRELLHVLSVLLPCGG